MSLNLALFVAVVILVVGWFAVGTHTNVRKGEAALRWLQDGLPLAGDKTTLRWLGSSVVELNIQHARPPFRQAEALLVLEPRDVAPLWWIARLRGRRDLFVFRASLNRRPRVEIEAHDPRAWTLGAPGKHEGWDNVTAPAPLMAQASQPRSASDVLTSIALDGCPPVRVTVRATEPHLEIQWRLPQICRHESRAVLERVRDLVQRL